MHSKAGKSRKQQRVALGGLNLKGSDFPGQRRWYQKWSLTRRGLPASPPPPRDSKGGRRGKETSEAIQIGMPLVCFTLACSNEQLKKASCCFWEVWCFFCFVQRPSQLPFSGRPFLYMQSAKVPAAGNRRRLPSMKLFRARVTHCTPFL